MTIFLVERWKKLAGINSVIKEKLVPYEDEKINPELLFLQSDSEREEVREAIHWLMQEGWSDEAIVSLLKNLLQDPVTRENILDYVWSEIQAEKQYREERGGDLDEALPGYAAKKGGFDRKAAWAQKGGYEDPTSLEAPEPPSSTAAPLFPETQPEPGEDPGKTIAGRPLAQQAALAKGKGQEQEPITQNKPPSKADISGMLANASEDQLQQIMAILAQQKKQ